MSRRVKVLIVGVLVVAVGAFAAACTDEQIAAYCAANKGKCRPVTTTTKPATTSTVRATTTTVSVPTTTTTVPATGRLIDRTDLIYGSEIGAWATNGNPTVDPNSGIPTLLKAANVPVMRFALFDCWTGMTCGSDNHAGSQSRTDFDHTIDGIRNAIGAEPWVKFVPIATECCNHIPATSFCPPLTNLGQNLPFFKAVVDQSAGRVHIFESNNEAEYACGGTWGISDGSVAMGKTIADMYSKTMPAVKKYARSKGTDIVNVAYIGSSGGTGWTGSTNCATVFANAYQGFNDEAYANFVASGNDPDFVPDAESVHAYPHSGDFPNGTDACIFTYFKTYLSSWRAYLVSKWGPTIGNQIKLSISEWNAGNLQWAGWSTPSTVQSFYDGFLRYVFQGKSCGTACSVGTTERLWNANLFDAATDGNVYDFVKGDGSTQPWYSTFKSVALSDPLG